MGGGDKVTSRLQGFHKLPMAERVGTVARMLKLDADEARALRGDNGLLDETANLMIENALGVFGLPMGVGLNLMVNGRDYLVPMVVEEPSVVAAVSFAAKVVRTTR